MLTVDMSTISCRLFYGFTVLTRTKARIDPSAIKRGFKCEIHVKFEWVVCLESSKIFKLGRVNACFHPCSSGKFLQTS